MSATELSQVETYIAGQADAFVADLCELLSIPSVSADSKYEQDVARAAEWVGKQFRDLGMVTEVHPTPGHPIVYAEWLGAPGAPTVLVYGHYDVQPPDPLNEWISPPFEPTVRDGNVYARGATDDKGQMLTHILSLRAWLKTVGRAPVNVKYLIEGEEEVGSDNLEAFLETHRERLKCDVVVVSDTCQLGVDQPAITYGLRGISYHELRLSGPKQDLHSGTFGGSVMNPAVALSKMLASLIDDEGRIQVPGFYDEVAAVSPREKAEFERLPFDEANFREQTGVPELFGEKGQSTLMRRWARPTFDVNGLTSGYQGEGAKTVLPAKASAKFSFRLVPYQNPDKIQAALKSYLESKLPPGVRMELINYQGSEGFVLSLDSPYVDAANAAIERGFGHRPYAIREGGSIPIISTFKRVLGADALLLGWGLNDDNAHSPNEKFRLADFQRGIKASAVLWEKMSEIGQR
ncbi:MAG TPA: dipeptidase [Pirellulales bacterium]